MSRKSTSRFCIFLGTAVTALKSKKQNTKARSYAEAEYRTLASFAFEFLWLKPLLRDFDINLTSSMAFCDRVNIMNMTSIPTNLDRMKHINIVCYLIREHIQIGFLKIIHVKFQDSWLILSQKHFVRVDEMKRTTHHLW